MRELVTQKAYPKSTGTLNQVPLQGLLRQLYGLGLPLISVVCVDE